MNEGLSKRYFEVPKSTVPAKLWLPSQAPRAVQLWLKQHSQYRAGPERPSDLFSDSRSFIPAEDEEWGIVLLQRSSVMALTVSVEVLDEDKPREDLTVGEEAGAHAMAVFLRDGTVLRGDLHSVFRDQQRRVQDLLNTDDTYFILQEGDRAHIVNKEWIILVRPSV